MSKPGAVLKELVDAGYFVANEAGWHAAVKPPSKKDLAWYVGAIKTLGSWSVGAGARVQVSSGSMPDEVLFRLSCDHDDIIERADTGYIYVCKKCGDKGHGLGR